MHRVTGIHGEPPRLVPLLGYDIKLGVLMTQSARLHRFGWQLNIWRRLEPSTLGPGDVFGDMAILSGETCSASVAVLQTATVKIVQRETFERELVRSGWMEILCKQLMARFPRSFRDRDWVD